MTEDLLKELILRDQKAVFRAAEEELDTVLAQLWKCALDSSEPKLLRKAAKKALYVLHSRGIDVDGARPERPEKSADGETVYQIGECVLSIPDSRWNSLMVFVLLEKTTSSMNAARFTVNLERGLTAYTQEHMAKKQISRIVQNTPGLFHVPEPYALYKLNTALEKPESGKISGVSSLPDVLRRKPQDPPRHPALENIPAQLSRLVKPDEEKTLFQQKEIVSLSLPSGEMREFKEEIARAKGSTLILQGKSPQERVKDIIEKLFTFYFTPAKRAMYSEAFLDIALYFFNTDRESLARLLVDYAKHLGTPSSKLQQNPVVNFLIYKEFFME
jgi:hypothetical protein